MRLSVSTLSASIFHRVCHRDTILPLCGGPLSNSPLLVRKGTNLSLDLYVLHQDPDYWGEDVDSFRPEQWEHLRPTWEYIPFSGVPRIFPAQQMVFVDVAFVVVRVLQNFERIVERGGLEGEF
ncbi:hypothetical protein EYC80_001300 [Monilinia laxa]|uniref:Cytochrome P450 n=1 Tax=Monilinia laxa TaxID=61186 RepID=A0A5N6K904_MONLA|nr:hypothetical protein EYC80_001300 [Monilinia laxa]